MSKPSINPAPILFWLKKRSGYVQDLGNWEWVLHDPLVGHLAPSLHLLVKQGALELPANIREEVEKAYRANQARAVLREHLLKQVAEAFESEGVSVIPLKGAAYLETLYGDIGLRAMSDVDLLVHPDDFLKTIQVMVRLGYGLREKDKHANIIWFADLPREYWPKELSFLGERGLVIELHQALIASWFQPAFPVDLEALWKESRQVEEQRTLPGGGVSLWKRHLSAGDTLAYMCLHLAMHGMQFPQAYTDLDAYIRALPVSWNWEEFLARVNQWQVRSSAYHAFLYCQKFMNTPLPEDLLDHLDPGWMARLRVTLLINPRAILANTQTLGNRYPTLVKVALVDRFSSILRIVFKLAFPRRAYYQDHPSRRNLLVNWRHILHVIKRGD
jgi:hypothetical protein